MELIRPERRNSYSEIFGVGWLDLAPGIRLAHSVPLRASGSMEFFRAPRGLAAWIGRRLPLPPEGEKVATQIELISSANGIEWNRRFDTVQANTLHKSEKDTYCEQLGPLSLIFRMEKQGAALAHTQIRTRVYGVPIPIWLGPRVYGLVSAGPDERSWHVSVSLRHAWLGTICRYQGVMHEE